MISKENIEEVRQRSSIVQVISEYMPLKKQGASYVGLCPFHSEKTPSFSVSEEKKIFYCFGCHETGSVFNFIMKKEGIAFPEAVRMLAARCGVAVSEEKKPQSGLREALYQANRAASEYFMKVLRSPEGRPASVYLGKRGFGRDSADLLTRFAVGFSEDRWDGLVRHLKSMGIPLEAASIAGLVVRKKEGGYYDRFRARLIFPITDLKGRVIAFGGRGLGSELPKYLNSPESPVFKKGSALFGLNHARESIVREGFALVVEGYFDLIALHRHGFTNSVASMGTALTPEQVRTLKGFCPALYALFDADEAGKKAAIRALDLFLSEDMPARAVVLPGAKDPDEFLAKKGPAAMRDAVNASIPLMEFYLRELGKRFNLRTPEGKKGYLNDALPYIKRITNVAERGHYAALAASALNIAVDSVYEAINAGERTKGARPGAGVTDARGGSLSELTVLRVILKHPELYNGDVAAAVSLFKDPDIREAGLLITSRLREGAQVNLPELIEGLPGGGVRARIGGALLKDGDGFIEEPEKMLKDSLKKILNRGKLKAATEEMIRQLESAQRPELASSFRERARSRSTLTKK